MMKKNYFKLLGLLVVTLLSWSGEASASVISTSRTLDQWRQESVKLMDKTFTYLSHDGFSSDQVVEFQYFDVNPNGYNEDFVSVQLLELTGLGSATETTTYTLDYSIQIDTLMAPNTWFATGDADVLHQHDSSLLTKDVKSGPTGPAIMATASAVNGAPDGPHAIMPGNALIYVSDVLTIGPGGIVSDISNTFEQTQVPEPATWALWSGLLGAGLWVRRRRRVTAAKMGPE
jgi:hypothetical protein